MQKLVDILKAINEESSVGGGTTAGANMTTGTGEQYSTKKAFKPVRKKLAKEDAPMLAAGKANLKTYKQDGFKANPSIPNRKSKVIDYKKMFEVEEEVINENYNQFRNSTKTRPKQDQFHQAVKEVKKKIAEANKLMEYVDRLQNELNEGGDSLKYKKHTTNALSQIKESVINLYKKVKSFK
jgi:hypothetical protein